MLKMSDEKKKPSVTIGVKFVDAPIKKALSDTAMEKTDEYSAGEWLEPPVPLQDLRNVQALFNASSVCSRL